MVIAFRVNGVPVAQPRHRVTTFGGHARAYLPKSHPVHEWKNQIAHSGAAALGAGALLEGPIELRAVFLMPRPGRLVWKNRPMVRVPHTTKPDLDNMLKALEDALNGVLWVDDSSVYRIEGEKFYCAGDESPGCEVKVVAAVAALMEAA